MESRDEYLRQLEQKTEDLITQARNVGAKANYRFVRSRMLMGRNHKSPATYLIAIAHVETCIASAIREREKRTSRRPLSLNLKSLFSLFVK